MQKLSLLKNSSDILKSITGIHTFPKGISTKVNATAGLKFDLLYYGVAVQLSSLYTTETSPAEWKMGNNS